MVCHHLQMCLSTGYHLKPVLGGQDFPEWSVWLRIQLMIRVDTQADQSGHLDCVMCTPSPSWLLEVVLSHGTYVISHLCCLGLFATWAHSQPFPLSHGPGSFACLSDLVLGPEFCEELATPFACFVFLVPGQISLEPLSAWYMFEDLI